MTTTQTSKVRSLHRSHVPGSRWCHPAFAEAAKTRTAKLARRLGLVKLHVLWEEAR